VVRATAPNVCGVLINSPANPQSHDPVRWPGENCPTVRAVNPLPGGCLLLRTTISLTLWLTACVMTPRAGSALTKRALVEAVAHAPLAHH